ncbi:MAG: MOSC N-terminal beta barrel domain-containing protein, partial [Ilumatobacter fluminis]
MQVVDIWRYPVKSLGGEQLHVAAVGPDGIVGDRSWGLRDRSTGLVLTARREPALLFLSGQYRPDGRPRITDEHGDELADDQALSERLGRPVELVAADD